MFHRFEDESPSDTEIEAWVTRVKGIIDAGGQVEWVQIYTTARKPSDDTVLPLDASFLQGISDALVDELGRDSQVRVTISA